MIPKTQFLVEKLLSTHLIGTGKIKRRKLPQYPDYLADNRATLSEEQYAAYNKQCELTRRFHHDWDSTALPDLIFA